MTPTATHTHRVRFEDRVPGKRFSTGTCACGHTVTADNWAIEDRDYTWKERAAYERAMLSE